MKTIHDQALEHVKRLAVDIGCRPIGSAANQAAAHYISDVFKKSGLELERQAIRCPDWFAEQTSLELNGEMLESSANTFSPSCDISVASVAVCTPTEMELAAMTGKILVLYGDMSQGELATKGGIYISDRDRRILQLLEERQPAGIITINPTLHACWRLIEDFDLHIPSITVSAHSGLKLLKNVGSTVHMEIVAHRSESHIRRGIRDIYHRPSDTLEWISDEKLVEAIQIALDLFEELDRKDVSWGRLKNQL